MTNLDWHQWRSGEVTFVELLVTSDIETRVRIESRLDPVWPPQCRGVQARGWTTTGYEGVVRPDGRLVLGFASPDGPTDPPVELSEATPVGSRSASDSHTTTPDAGDPGETARTLVRTLGPPGPPRDALPGAQRGKSVTQHADVGRAATGAGATAADDRQHPDQQAHTATAGPAESRQPNAAVPGSLQSWFDELEDRLTQVETLTDVSCPAEARTAIESAGGMAGVHRLAAQLERDRQRLESLGSQYETYARRLETAEVPVETLKRLA